MTFEQTCANCKFSRSPLGPRGSASLLACRATPPRLSYFEDGDQIAVWPMVHLEDWCGSWVRKPIPRDPPSRVVRDPSGPDL